MQPGRGREGEDGCKGQGKPSATGHGGRDRHAPSTSSPPFVPSPGVPSEKKLKGEQRPEEEEQPAASLPEDALTEILSRVPYRSLCRFKCVSRPWRALCSANDIRRRSPQTLSGFFHFGTGGLKFRNLSGRGLPMVDPSLPFLRERYRYTTVEQCCSSLLLCKCYKSLSEGLPYDYVVCNPATGWMVVLPPIALPGGNYFDLEHSNIFFGFDTAALSRFVVFAALCSYCDEVAEVAIYSSETGRWTFVQSRWGNKTSLVGNPEFVFLNGIMHFTTYYFSLVTVDPEGKVWRKIKMPRSVPGRSDDTIASVGQSQGRLHAWRIDNYRDCQLYVWVLEDYDSGKWTLKHSVDVLELFGRPRRKVVESYKMFAIHPEYNLVFITDGEEMSVSYDMDNQEVHVISTSEEFLDGLPYTPCFAEWPLDGH